MHLWFCRILVAGIMALAGMTNVICADNDMYFNAGHPGVPEPHYQVILWYISPEKAAGLK